MSRLWSCGFELNSNSSNVEVNNFGSNSSIVTSPVHGGTYAFDCNVSASQSVNTINIEPSDTTGALFFRSYIYLTSLPPSTTANILALNSNAQSTGWQIKLTSGGNLQLFDTVNAVQIGSNSSALSTGQWYRIEVKADMTTIASTVLDARINGVSFASATVGWGNGLANLSFGITGGSNTFRITFDDMALNDNTGSFQTSYPGDSQILHMQPAGTGDNNAWSIQVGGTAGSTNNYTRVDEVTPDDATTYNADATSGDIDDYTLISPPAAIGSSDTINVVAVGVRFSAAVAAAEATFVTRVKATSGGTVAESSTISPNNTGWRTNAPSGKLYPLNTYQKPGTGTAWAKSDLSTTQIGIRINGTNTNAAQVSTVWLLVDFTPSGGGPTTDQIMAAQYPVNIPYFPIKNQNSLYDALFFVAPQPIGLTVNPDIDINSSLTYWRYRDSTVGY